MMGFKSVFKLKSPQITLFVMLSLQKLEEDFSYVIIMLSENIRKHKKQMECRLNDCHFDKVRVKLSVKNHKIWL